VDALRVTRHRDARLFGVHHPDVVSASLARHS